MNLKSIWTALEESFDVLGDYGYPTAVLSATSLSYDRVAADAPARSRRSTTPSQPQRADRTQRPADGPGELSPPRVDGGADRGSGEGWVGEGDVWHNRFVATTPHGG